MRRLLLLLLLLLGAAPLSVQAAETAVLRVTVDQGVPITLERAPNSVFVANPEVADIQLVGSNLVTVFGKSVGTTTVIAVDEANQVVLHRQVVVTQNLVGLQTALEQSLPDSTIRAESVPGGIVLSGTADSPAAAENARRLAGRFLTDEGEVINQLGVGGSTQIQLRVRVAEVSRSVTKQFGINWDGLLTTGNFVFGLASGEAVLTSTGAFNRPNDANTIGMSYSRGNRDVNGLLDALASDGFVTILAEPNLTALSGENASFLAGGQFPILVPQSDGTVGIEFQEYGVILSFTPTLVGKARINMRVRPEVIQLSSVGAVELGGFQVPGLAVRRAETTVELGSGQSFAIAGLLDNSQNQTVDKFPFLGDLPVLGPLFRSSRYTNQESELVIIVTPYLVEPVQAAELMVPNDEFTPANDFTRLLLNRRYEPNPHRRGAPTPTADAAADIQLVGDYGFSLPGEIAR